MELIQAFFSVETTAFSLFGYDISWLELVGTIFNLACVILVARRNIWTWPVGIVGVILFGILFYQINLYADMIEQVYYLVTGFVGWYAWAKLKKRGDDDKVQITTNSTRTNLAWLAGIVGASAITAWALTQVHVWAPVIFPEPADLPIIDATTTMMSFAAQFLMMQRRLESWILWIVVDIVAVWLYWYKGVPFLSLQYLVFLGNAIYGFVGWQRARRTIIETDKEDA